MYISDNTLEILNTMFTVSLIDDYINEVPKENAVAMQLGFEKDGSKFTGNYIGKTIKSTKKEISVDYVLSKLNSDKVYHNFCNTFEKLLDEKSLTLYPTSYGIGIWVALTYRSEITRLQSKVEAALSKYNIDYSNEYSDAGWVFRYKISKSKENITKLEAING
jgi:hypothetical protein